MKKGRDSAMILRKPVCAQLPLRRVLDAALDSPRIWMEALEARRMFSASSEIYPPFGINGTASLSPSIQDAIIARSLVAGPNNTTYAAAVVFSADNEGLPLLTRFNADGSRDRNFGRKGFALFPASASVLLWANQLLVEADGKVIIVADTPTGPDLIRFDSNGRADNSFGIGGVMQIPFIIHQSSTDQRLPYEQPAIEISIEQDGKIMVVNKLGTAIELLRFNTDGSPDQSFGSAGRVLFPLEASAEDWAQVIFAGPTPDGGVAVYIITPTTLDTIGQPELSPVAYRFDADGHLISRHDILIAVQNFYDVGGSVMPDGGALLWGYNYGLGASEAQRVLPDGTFDPSFNALATTSSQFPKADNWVLASLASDGSFFILAGFEQTNLMLQRFNADGTPDTVFRNLDSFAQSGFGITAALPLADGAILISGDSGTFDVRKALPDGATFALRPPEIVPLKELAGQSRDPNLIIPIGSSGKFESSDLPYAGLFGTTSFNVLDSNSQKKLLDDVTTDF